MELRPRNALLSVSRIVIVALGAAILFAAAQRLHPQSDDVSPEGAALDRRLSDAYLKQDWPALEKIVAPDYSVLTADGQWDYATLKREFPKIHAKSYQVERQVVKRLSADLILVNDVVTMEETYDGQDISGRYWMSDLWVRRDGKWLLLVEQEVPLK